MVNTKRVKVFAISLGIILFLIISSVTFSVFYILSYMLTSFGSLALFVFSIWLFLRLVAKILVFPGSCWFWKRSIEANFCHELSNNVFYKVRDLRQYLLAIKNQDRFNLQSNSSVLIESVIERFQSIAGYSKLSRFQSRFVDQLEELRKTLQDTMVIIDSSCSKSLWEWLQERVSRSDPSDIVYEDYPDCHQAKRLIKICEELESGLLKSCGTTTTRKRLSRWLFDDTIGNIHYMREDLIRRYSCEQIWVTSNNAKIDCLYLNSSSDGPTILFCNPNAGFYEFAFYQSEWFEFYYRRGINVMYWNYRGFGRSQGKPSIRQTCKDGEEIIKFLREKKSVKILGIHGESLGGSIASYLADQCGANFLFADRTFSSLKNAAYYNFGKCAYLGLRLAGRDDIDVSSHFLQTKCYKVLSCDPKDNMINDLASLKAAVAKDLLYTKPPKTHILLLEHMIAFKQSLERIQILLSKLNNFSKDNGKGTGKYLRLSEDLEMFDNDKFKETLLKLKLLLNGIEAGGVTLLGCLRSKAPDVALLNWVCILDVWGSSTIMPRSSPLHIASDSLKNIIREVETLFDVTEIKKEIQDIHLALTAIKSHLDNRLDFSDTRSLSTSQEFKLDIDYEKAGFLLPINCGHAGPFSTQERFYYEQHLTKARFIK